MSWLVFRSHAAQIQIQTLNVSSCCVRPIAMSHMWLMSARNVLSPKGDGAVNVKSHWTLKFLYKIEDVKYVINDFHIEYMNT